MSERNTNETVTSLFNGMENIFSTKTVVGEAIHVNDTVIVPLVDVSFGMGAGGIGGGMGGKMSPTAVLVIKENSVRMVPVAAGDPVSKVIDMAPDLINRFVKKDKLDPEVEDVIDNIAADAE